MTRYRSHRYKEYLANPPDLDSLYQDNNWSSFAHRDHEEQIVRVGKMLPLEEVNSVGDMSAGGSRVPWELAGYYECIPPDLGDLGRLYGYPRTGTLQETLPTCPVYDLYVCTETIEHLWDPDGDLKLIRPHARRMLLTTPTKETPELVSHGHLWTWEREDVEFMLAHAGFTVMYFEPYSIFGIWMCE